jgi:hypothetical protein
VDVDDRRIFAAGALDSRAHEHLLQLREQVAARITSDMEPSSALEKLFAQHRTIVAEATSVVKALLPDRYARHCGEYYSTTHFDVVREHLGAVDKYFRTLEVHTELLARTEQPSSMLQGIAVDVARDAAGYIDRCRSDAATVRAVALREYPRGSYVDTVCLETGKGSTYLKDSSGYLIFQNREILRVNLRPVEEFPQLYKDLPVGITDDGHHVIQQSGMQGCVGAATNMILMDFNRPPDLNHQYTSHFDNDETIVSVVQRAGLRAQVVALPTLYTAGAAARDQAGRLEVSALQARSLEELTSHGKGVLLSLSSEIGGHQVVLDRFSTVTGRATVRDPLHGWSIDVEHTAVLQRIGGSAVRVTDPL